MVLRQYGKDDGRGAGREEVKDAEAQRPEDCRQQDGRDDGGEEAGYNYE